ncbi:MAG: DUF1570 domain-containing protein [Phycisphaerales bacterium]|nr:MAG: DUF1570 domain-containing protein [Phycisphaerales bacterium]
MRWTLGVCEFVAVVLSASAALAAAPDGDAPIPVDAQAEAELLAIAGDGFAIRRTDHFVIAHNTSDDIVANFLTRAERTYNAVFRFCRAGDIPVRAPARRLAVLFFDTPEGFHRYGDSIGFHSEGASGVFSIHLNRAAFFNTLKTRRMVHLTNIVTDLENRLSRPPGVTGLRPGERKAARRRLQVMRNQRNRFVTRTNRLVIQHEVTHQVFYNIGVHTVGAQNPGWLVEGLACLFETPPNPSGASFAAINQMRLRDFRECLTPGDGNFKPRPEHLDHACRSGRFVPLKDLIGDARIFARAADPNIVYQYAEAWSLVHYLQRRHQKEFARYIQQLSQRQPSESFSPQQEVETFEAIFGPINDHFERRWISYVLRLPFRPAEAGG